MALRLVSDAPARSGGLRLVEDVAPVGRLTAKASGGAGFKDKKAEAIWGGSFDEWKKRKEAADAEQARMVAESEAGNVGSRRAQDFQRKVAALNAEGDLTGDYSADSLRPGRALESGMEQGREQIGAGLQLAGETPLALADFFGRIRPKGETEQDRANPLTEAGKDIRSAAIARQQELAPLMIDRPDSLLSLQGAKYIAQSTLQSAPVTGTGLAAAVVNPAAGLSLMGAGAGSAKFADARAEDKNFWLAAEAGAAAAAAEVVPEMLPLGFLSGRLMKHLPGSAMKRMAANPAGRGALLALSEGASEGVTELANIAYEIGREGKSYTDDQIEKRLIDATAVGTVMGGGMSAVAELSGQNQRAYDASGIARLELENSLRDAIKPARATTARILGPAATPEAAAGAQMADDAFKAAGVGTVAAADIAEQDALERDLDAATRDQLGSEAEIDRLLTGGINAQAQAGSPGTVLDGQDAGRTGAAIPGISGSLPAGVRASYPGDQAESGSAVGFVGNGSLGSRDAPAPQQFTELANGTVFVPGDPVQLRQRIADAGFDVQGLAETRNGIPGVRFGANVKGDVLGVLGGNREGTGASANTGIAGAVSASSEGLVGIAPARGGLPPVASGTGSTGVAVGELERMPANRVAADARGIGEIAPTQAAGAVDGRVAETGVGAIVGATESSPRTNVAMDAGRGDNAGRIGSVFADGDNRGAESNIAVPSQPAPPALQDLTDDERNFWGALTSEVRESIDNPGGRMIRNADGSVGRTKWADLGPMSGFWRDRPKGWNSDDVLTALDRAASGEKLSIKQRNIVDYAKGWVRDYTAQHKDELAVHEADSRQIEREQIRGDIESTLASVADTSPQQRASVVSLGSDYTRRLLELKKLRGSWGLNPDQQEEYTNLLEQDRETGKVGGRPIPGVGNKVAFVDALEQGRIKPVIGFGDLDNFKAINDKFGHEAGDEVIRAYAEHIASEFPGSTWGRGGDEFLVDGASREEIDAKMTRVRAKMAAEKFEITLADGSIATLEGVQFSYGTGATESEADANLKQDKSDRKAAGLRYDREESDARRVDAPTDRRRTPQPGQDAGRGDSSGDAAAEGVGDGPQERAGGAQGTADRRPDVRGDRGGNPASIQAGMGGRDTQGIRDVQETESVQRSGVNAGRTDAIRAAISQALGPKFLVRLDNQKWFQIVDSVADLPPDVRKSITGEGVAGFVLPDGRVFIVAEGAAANPVGVTLHELGVHYGMTGILGEDFAPTLAKFKRLRAKDDRVGRAYERAAEAADKDKNGELTDAAKATLDEEALAYFVEQNWNKPDTRGIVAKVIDAIKRLLNRAGIRMSWLNASPELLREVAIGAARAAADGAVSVRDGKIVYHRAFHGSPHDFDEFRLDDSTIGTGEGAQAFGHGLYFAGRKELGEYYRKQLSISQQTLKDLASPYDDAGYSDEEAITKLRRAADVARRNERNGEAADYDETARWIESGRPANFGGRLYEVELAPTEDQYLDWDAPLSEQSALVKRAARSTFKQMDESFLEDALDRLNVTPEEMTGREFYKLLAKALEQDAIPVNRGSKTERYVEAGNTEAAASASLLDDEGVPGIRYLDGSSRGKGEGSRNFVIFDDSSVKVVAKYSRKADGGSDAVKFFDEDAEYRTVQDVLDGLSSGALLVHARVPDGTDFKYGIDPSAGDFLRSTEAWQTAEDQFGEGPELTFFAEDLAWAKSEILKTVRGGGDLELVFVRKSKDIQKSLGDGRVQLHDGKVVPYERSPIADYESDNFKDEPAGVESGDWYTNKSQDVVAAGPAKAFIGSAAPKYSRNTKTITINGTERPTTDSTGKAIHPTDEGVRNFYAWFKDSKVVDDQGRPLVVYHGTAGEFDAFDRDAPASHISLPGFFFTPDADIAGQFADGAAHRRKLSGATPRTIPAYVSTRNPAILKYDDRASGRMTSERTVRSDLADARKAGHDGAIITGWADGSGDIQYVAFRPTQIKSAESNTGTFSPTDPRIAYSRKTAEPEGLPPPVAIESHLSNMLKLRAFFDSAVDVMARQPGLKPLADAVRSYFDNVRRRQGLVNEVLRAPVKAASKADLDAFERYQYALQNNLRDDVAEELAGMTDKGRALVSAWEKIAKLTNDENQKVGVQVFDPKIGGWRKIGTARNFFPRVLKPKFQEAMRQPHKYPTEWNRLVRILLDAGRIQSAEDAQEFLNTAFSNESAFEYFAGIEKARMEPLPRDLYDYSMDAAIGYKDAWADRLSQIEAFGQKIGQGDQAKDKFDEVLMTVTDDNTRNYVTRVRERITNTNSKSPFYKFMANMNTLVTGLMLGNPATAALNIVGGLSNNAMVFPLGPNLKALKELRNLGAGIRDAVAKGVLIDDYMGVSADAAAQGVSERLSNLTQGLLNWGGYNGTEYINRVHSMLVGKHFLSDSLAAINKNPRSRKSLLATAFMQRNGFDVDTLAAESTKPADERPETNKFLRFASNLTQGSYKIDQTPIFVDEPIGKFLFKYQKFGTQINRVFYQQMLRPFVQSVFKGGEPITLKNADGTEAQERVRNFVPLLRFIAGAIPGGMLVQFIREALFGYGEDGPDEDEIRRKLADGETAAAAAMLAERAFIAITALGAGGFLGNYMQTAKDFQERQRFKNPLDPPGLAPVKSFANFVMKLNDQGKITLDDIEQEIQNNVSLYRTGKRLLSSGINMVNDESVTFAAREAARREHNHVRYMARRYADSVGIEAKRRAPSEIAATANTPTNRAIKDALLLGDGETARALAAEYVASFDNAYDAANALASIRNSIRLGQPALVQLAPSEAERRRFMRWAFSNLTPEGYARIKDTDEKYRKAAASSGLWKPESDAAAMKRDRKASESKAQWSDSQRNSFLRSKGLKR